MRFLIAPFLTILLVTGIPAALAKDVSRFDVAGVSLSMSASEIKAALESSGWVMQTKETTDRSVTVADQTVTYPEEWLFFKGDYEAIRVTMVPPLSPDQPIGQVRKIGYGFGTGKPVDDTWVASMREKVLAKYGNPDIVGWTCDKGLKWEARWQSGDINGSPTHWMDADIVCDRSSMDLELVNFALEDDGAAALEESLRNRLESGTTDTNF